MTALSTVLTDVHLTGTVRVARVCGLALMMCLMVDPHLLTYVVLYSRYGHTYTDLSAVTADQVYCDVSESVSAVTALRVTI